MTKFDELPKELQEEALKAAEHVLNKKKFIDKLNTLKQEEDTKTLKEFFNKKGKLWEDVMPMSDLVYDEDKVVNVQNTSGQFVERAIVTFDNSHQLTILRAPYEYGADQNVFDVSARLPDGTSDLSLLGETSTGNVLPGQTLKDVSKHMKTLSEVKVPESIEIEDDEQEK